MFPLDQPMFIPVTQDLISLIVQAIGAGIAASTVPGGSQKPLHLVRVALLFFRNLRCTQT